MTMVRDSGNRDSFSSTASSVWVDRLDSNDWIAPCDEPLQTNAPVAPAQPPKTAPRRRISLASDAGDARELWECMLELQQRYGCYRSARMEAAISAYDGTDLMPSRACLDFLNESIVEENLPEEGWRMLAKFVPGLREARGEKKGWRFWKRNSI